MSFNMNERNEKKKCCIITGATSFIGIALIHELVGLGYYVYAIIKPGTSRKKLLYTLFPDVMIIECDLKKLDRLKEIICSANHIEAFYHIGWDSSFDNPRENLLGQMQNVDHLLCALKTAKELDCNKFISVGSQAECGVVDTPINSRTLDNPITAYAKAKCKSYQKGCELSDELGIDFYWPRLLSAYGPFDRRETLVMSCITSCINHRIINMTKAEQVWDYVYVGDVARALRLIVEKGKPKKKYSIASGVGRPLLDYIKDISEVFEFPKLMNGIGKREYAENEVMYLVGDISEIQNDTGIIFNTNFKNYINDMRKELIGEDRK